MPSARFNNIMQRFKDTAKRFEENSKAWAEQVHQKTNEDIERLRAIRREAEGLPSTDTLIARSRMLNQNAREIMAGHTNQSRLSESIPQAQAVSDQSANNRQYLDALMTNLEAQGMDCSEVRELSRDVTNPESASVDAERENILSDISSARFDNPVSTQQGEVRGSNSGQKSDAQQTNNHWNVVKNWVSPVIGSLVACICISFSTPIWVALLLSVLSAIVTAALLHSPLFK